MFLKLKILLGVTNSPWALKTPAMPLHRHMSLKMCVIISLILELHYTLCYRPHQIMFRLGQICSDNVCVSLMCTSYKNKWTNSGHTIWMFTAANTKFHHWMWLVQFYYPLFTQSAFLTVMLMLFSNYALVFKEPFCKRFLYQNFVWTSVLPCLSFMSSPAQLTYPNYISSYEKITNYFLKKYSPFSICFNFMKMRTFIGTFSFH